MVAELAADSGISRSKYVTALVLEAVRLKRRFRYRRGEFIEETSDRIPETHGKN